MVIKSLTKNDLLLRDLTLSRAILMVLFTGFGVDFELERIGMRFVRLAVCLSFAMFTLLVVTTGMQKVPCFDVGDLGSS